MFTNIDEFIHTFQWYRNISLKLLDQLQETSLNDRLSPRSLTLNYQIIDLGDMQLRVLERLTGKKIPYKGRPSDVCTSKKEISEYLKKCMRYFCREIKNIDSDKRMDWFGQMNLNFSETLSFILAHEAMHHGEILSFIYARNLPMPPIFKNTFGF